MNDREKVIEELERVANAIVDGYIHEPARAVNAIADAITMLKEQEAIKPTVIVDTWVCSNCGHALERQELYDDGENPQILLNEQYAFCPSCGKAVKWE